MKYETGDVIEIEKDNNKEYLLISPLGIAINTETGECCSVDDVESAFIVDIITNIHKLNYCSSYNKTKNLLSELVKNTKPLLLNPGHKKEFNIIHNEYIIGLSDDIVASIIIEKPNCIESNN